ncbi:MAG: hypothetical protein WCP11_02585 [Candidatus Saccharibacteria bacterium]
MTQNEFQIPGRNLDNTDLKGIRKNLEDIYTENVIKRPEVLVGVSDRLYEIADNLAEARRRHLDSPRANHAAEKGKITRVLGKMLFGRELSADYVGRLNERELKIEESEIGAEIFGPIPSNERRAFFNDNRQSWFYYEEKTDVLKQKHSTTLHYEVQPNGVLRINVKNGMKCEYINGQEVDNFVDATEIYYDRVTRQIYSSPTIPDSQKAA